MDRVPTVDVGVLGVVTSEPEVVAVFPQLSSTILPHSQEIRFYRGDSIDIGVQVQDDRDPADPVNLDHSVMRFSAKQRHGGMPTTLKVKTVIGNETSLVSKSSYSPSEIEIVSAQRGRAVIHLDRDDTHLLPSEPALWDIELTRPAAEITLPHARVLFVPGDNVVLSMDPALDWVALGLRPGDIFRAQDRTVLVRAVLGIQHLQLDWSDWAPGQWDTLPMRAWRGRTKTVAFGSFVALGDITR